MRSVGRSDDDERATALPQGNGRGPHVLTMVWVIASNPNTALSDCLPQQTHCSSVRSGRRLSLLPIGRTWRRPVLSAREVEVLIAWLHTDSKSEVGRQLFITTSTVNTHLVRIRQKYANVGRPARTKAALAARAIQDGLIDLFDLGRLGTVARPVTRPARWTAIRQG